MFQPLHVPSSVEVLSFSINVRFSGLCYIKILRDNGGFLILGSGQ